MKKPRVATLIGVVLLAAFSRLVPHPWNFTPIGAMALFSGAHFSDKRLAFSVPLSALFLSDLFLGFYKGLPFVYGTFALIVCLGFWIKPRKRALPIGAAALSASLLFYVSTNFWKWALGVLYPKTFAGLVTCFIAALPFLQNTMAGDLVYTALLFGSWAWAERAIPVLQERPTLVHA